MNKLRLTIIYFMLQIFKDMLQPNRHNSIFKH